MNKHTLKLIFAVVLISCGQNPVVDSNINRIVVQAVLSPEFARQTIYVGEGTNVAFVDGLKLSELEKPLAGATVVVRSASQTVTFVEVSPGTYQDDRLRVEPGETYSLEITARDGRIIRAQTTVPMPVRFSTPSEGDTFLEDQPVEFTWEPSQGARLYVLGEIIPECSSKFSERGAFKDLRFTGDTQILVWFSQWEECDATVRPIMNLRLLAVDRAAADFIWFNRYFSDNNQRSNIENGFGVFGAMVSDSLKIRVVKPQ